MVATTELTPPGKVPVGPLAGSANVTATPATGFVPLSVTFACNATGNAAPAAADWGVPAIAKTLAGGPAVLVNTNSAGVATPATVAVAEYDPTVPIARTSGDVATPNASVVAAATYPSDGNSARAPDAGSWNVTETPGIGVRLASRTSATRRCANVEPNAADCGVPSCATMLAGAPIAARSRVSRATNASGKPAGAPVGCALPDVPGKFADCV